MDRFLNAYCGTPPDLESIWGRWNLDPALIAILLGLLGLALWTTPNAPRRWALGVGWSVAAIALISPLCALSVSLFAARIGQHVLLALIAAPLLGFALRGAFWPRPLQAAAVFAGLMWFWHAPGPYAWTFETDVVYWTMHITLFGAAIWLWQSCLARLERVTVAAAPGLLLAGVQMALLGALITFAPRPLYAPHALTTGEWGLTPLEDQQLGGALMWAPGGLLFLVASLWAIWSLLTRLERDGSTAAA